MTQLAPGGRLGILGGGQLGRMLSLAAAELGLACHIYCPNEDNVAGDVAAHTTLAPYDDEAALIAFADSVDVVTYEFENVPAPTAQTLSAHATVRPGPNALATAQDRLTEKTFLQDIKIATAPFAAIGSTTELAAALSHLGTPAILKTRRLGYDGKGQVKISDPAHAGPAFDEIGQSPALLEGFVPFEREISVIIARGHNSKIAAYDPVENIHRDHILAETHAPARIAPEITDEAQRIAGKIVTALDYVGIMGVEMFLLPEGTTGPRLLVNEIAPRVHNSGHWTMDACQVSQFEQHVRAVCGWPLGNPARHADAHMVNLIGADVDDWARHAAEPNSALHLYGKSEARPGRKMGHVTKLLPKS